MNYLIKKFCCFFTFLLIGFFIFSPFLTLADSSANFKIIISPSTQCSDGGDNDGDGKIDFPADPGCSSASDDSEADTVSPGGGGGGGGYTAPSSITFIGRAFPLSRISILKDGQTAITTIAGPDANFNVNLTNLSAGNYNFAVSGLDKDNNQSALFTFPVYITAGANTTVSGIFIAPTIAVDKTEVKRGDNIAFFGQSAPQGEITIAINSASEIFAQTKADKNGVYLYNFDTAPLETGAHSAKSKAAISGEISNFGKTIAFAVSAKSVPAGAVKKIKGDLNGDGKVNLIDFSIAAYWYRRKPNAAFIKTEKGQLNGDGKIDLKDFSIIAYYWTG